MKKLSAILFFLSFLTFSVKNIIAQQDRTLDESFASAEVLNHILKVEGQSLYHKKIFEKYKTQSKKELNIKRKRNNNSFRKIFQNTLTKSNNSTSTSSVDSIIVITKREKEKHIYEYDPKGKIVLHLIKKMADGHWANYERITKTETDDSNETKFKELTENWKQDKWMNSKQIIDILDSDGNFTFSSFEMWDTNGQLKTLDQTTITYETRGNAILSISISKAWENGHLEYAQRYKRTMKNGKIVSILGEEWKNGQWIGFEKNSFEYDFNGNKIYSLSEKWENGQWTKNWEIKKYYNSNQKVIVVISEKWDDGYLKNGWRTRYIYNSDTSYIEKREIWKNDQWVNRRRINRAFDSNGNDIYSLYEKWEENKWVNHRRINRAFDSNGNDIYSLYEKWEENRWVNQQRNNYNYNPNGKKILQLSEYWQKNQWVISSRISQTFDSNGKTTFYLEERRNNEQLQNYRKRNFTYNSNGEMILALYEDWYLGGGLDKSERVSYTYDLNGNIVLFLYDRLVGGPQGTTNDNLWFEDSYHNSFDFRGREINIYYNTITGISKSDLVSSKFSLSQNYPNPFNPTTTIKYSIPVVDANFASTTKGNGNIRSVQIKVYDILGKEVATLVNEKKPAGNYEVMFDGSNLTSGIYFCCLTSGDFRQTKKLVLLK